MVNKISEMLKPALDERGIEIYDIEYVKENDEYYLRVYIDCENGVDLNTVVEMTPVISDILDEHDPIKNEYILEVSSPGAEKKLKNEDDIKSAIGEYIYVELFNPIKGIDSVNGNLLSFENNILVIQYFLKGAKKKLEVPYENIKFIRLAIKL